MERRIFLCLVGAAAAAWPIPGSAQDRSKILRVGVLSPGHPPPDDPFHQAERFEAALVELGWKLGSTVIVDYRYAKGKLDHLAQMARELATIPADVIVARGQTIAAVQSAAGSIPIVMAADPDPIGNGFIKSLARPGGNITGLTTLAFELEAKQVELLSQAVPSLSRVAILTSSKNTVANAEQTSRRAEAASKLKIELLEYPIASNEELATAFANMKEQNFKAVLVSGTLWFIDRAEVARLAMEHRLATIAPLREFVDAGALMTYGVNFAAIHRRAASYVDKLLKGANPAEMPVEQPTRFELAINLKSATVLGLKLPSTLLVMADEVIE
jgi:putative tryptophan/tyrosine transport system substrate-binding protein